MLADSDAEENPANVVDLRELGFPVRLRMQSREVVIGSWEELLRFIEERPAGVSEITHLLSFSVQPCGKRISLNSLVSQDVAPFFMAYNAANSEWAPPLYGGTLRDWPAILVEAFQVIQAEQNSCERRRIQAQRREIQNRQNG